MCDPVSAISAAALAAGTGAQIMGQNQARKAQRGVVAAERGRQQGYQERQAAAVDTATQGASRPAVEAATAERTAARAADLREAAPQQTGYLPGQSAGPQIVRDEVDRQRGIVSAFTNQQGDARAALGGFGDAVFRANTGIGRAAQDVGVQGGFARGSAGLLPLDLNAASYKGQGLRTAGDLLVLAGTAAPGLAQSKTLGSIFARGGGVKTAPIAATGRFPGPI